MNDPTELIGHAAGYPVWRETDQATYWISRRDGVADPTWVIFPRHPKASFRQRGIRDTYTPAEEEEILAFIYAHHALIS